MRPSLEPVQIKRKVANALFGHKAMIENAIIKEFAPADQLHTVEMKYISDGGLEAVVQIKMRDQGTRYYKIRVSEVTT